MEKKAELNERELCSVSGGAAYAPAGSETDFTQRVQTGYGGVCGPNAGGISGGFSEPTVIREQETDRSADRSSGTNTGGICG